MFFAFFFFYSLKTKYFYNIYEIFTQLHSATMILNFQSDIVEIVYLVKDSTKPRLKIF